LAGLAVNAAVGFGERSVNVGFRFLKGMLITDQLGGELPVEMQGPSVRGCEDLVYTTFGKELRITYDFREQGSGNGESGMSLSNNSMGSRTRE
jgi:hypothetical protein